MSFTYLLLCSIIDTVLALVAAVNWSLLTLNFPFPTACLIVTVASNPGLLFFLRLVNMKA